MPARSGSGYAPLDVEATRNAVSAGKQVRVGILPTHQFPDGAAGRVRAVGFPGSNGPEFIDVEVTVGGAKDVIPFAPTDLSPIKRTQSAPELVAPPRRRRAPTRSPRAAATPAKLTPSPASSPSASPASSLSASPASSPSALQAPARALPPAQAQLPIESLPDDTPPAPARRSVRGKRQPIVITLATTEPDHTGWQLEVKVGSRLVVKPTIIHPARAWSLVTDLGNPEVGRVVASALNEHRQQAQERADRLARELAEAQAELANYPAF